MGVIEKVPFSLYNETIRCLCDISKKIGSFMSSIFWVCDIKSVSDVNQSVVIHLVMLVSLYLIYTERSYNNNKMPIIMIGKGSL